MSDCTCEKAGNGEIVTYSLDCPIEAHATTAVEIAAARNPANLDPPTLAATISFRLGELRHSLQALRSSDALGDEANAQLDEALARWDKLTMHYLLPLMGQAIDLGKEPNHGNGTCSACGHTFAPGERTVVVAPQVYCDKNECHRQATA